MVLDASRVEESGKYRMDNEGKGERMLVKFFGGAICCFDGDRLEGV